MRWSSALATCLLTCTLVPPGGLALAGQQTKYGISVKASKPATLAKAKTYTWTDSHRSFNETIHARIVAAVDRELQARGLRKMASGRGDLIVTYGSLSRTDIDLKKAERGEAPEYAVGTLVIDLLDPSSRSSLFRVRLDTPLDPDPAKLDATIDRVVAAMFEKYPGPAKR